MTPRRITVVAPRVRMDVGLPQSERTGAGWALSRIGDTPLPPGVTVSAAALRDGEVLYLRPRGRYETPLLFDDVVDAIASAAQTRRGAWRPKVGRRLGLASPRTRPRSSRTARCAHCAAVAGSGPGWSIKSV